jgi:hypothetical protein
MTLVDDIRQSREALAAIALVATGVALLFVGTLTATTDVFDLFIGSTTEEAWWTAGVLAGLGLPIAVVGVFVVLPATDFQRLGAAVGLAVAVLGVILFALSFPHQWQGDAVDRSLLVVLTYLTGALLTITYLFLAVANFSPTVVTVSETSPFQRHPQRQGAPSTALELVRAVGRHVLSDDDGPAGPTNKDVTDELDRRLDTLIVDEPRVTKEGRIVVHRSDGVAHASFVAALPHYVSVVGVEDTKYSLALDVEAFLKSRR